MTNECIHENWLKLSNMPQTEWNHSLKLKICTTLTHQNLLALIFGNRCCLDQSADRGKKICAQVMQLFASFTACEKSSNANSTTLSAQCSANSSTSITAVQCNQASLFYVMLSSARERAEIILSVCTLSLSNDAL